MATREVLYLLDTQAWIWLIGGHERAGRLKRLQRNARLLLSVVSIWGSTLLHRKGRLILKPNPRAFFDSFIEAIGIKSVPVSRFAAMEAFLLPSQFHADPADRLLVAITIELGAILITADERILEYKHPKLRTFRL
ncbi:MAG: type II toxin-antitoxin system VapC family toxin [Verrucomicrobia bacterium]|nr:type II toxin-antitoxin system VapC family toxin [Verrucomicrobiota bacterium]